MTPVVIYTCDAWKSWDSSRLVGVYTNRKKMERLLRKMIKAGYIEFADGWDGEIFSRMTIDQMRTHIDYLIIQEIELNSEI
jgi:hypothetical protein